jgi:GTP-binding protein
MNIYDFKQAKFYDTVNDLDKLPDISKLEIAIVGRSNAGKSSLLNTLTNQNKLAFTSKTPGRTQHINYFTIDKSENIFLVDLPGYGYAKVPESIRKHWILLLGNYLKNRQQLAGLVLIMDVRHPLKDLDLHMIEFFRIRNLPIHIVLSKADKISKSENINTINKVKERLGIINLSNYTIQLFSSLKKNGVNDLVAVLNSWLVKSTLEDI